MRLAHEERWLIEREPVETNVITVEKWGEEALAENSEDEQILPQSRMDPQPCDWIPSGAREKSYFRWIDECFFTRSPGVGLKEQFQELTSRWKDDTSDFSILALRYANDSFLRIVGFGPIAIPWILEELRNDPDWWFEALRAITREDPASDAESFDSAVEAWLKWGSDNGYDV
ncbi:MAG TPA: hypothetical protein VF773_18785 [Verrucomicrobiae bacterium]